MEGVLIEADSELVPQLTENDYLLIGSFNFSEEIIARLQASGCRAKMIELKR